MEPTQPADSNAAELASDAHAAPAYDDIDNSALLIVGIASGVITLALVIGIQALYFYWAGLDLTQARPAVDPIAAEWEAQRNAVETGAPLPGQEEASTAEEGEPSAPLRGLPIDSAIKAVAQDLSTGENPLPGVASMLESSGGDASASGPDSEEESP